MDKRAQGRPHGARRRIGRDDSGTLTIEFVIWLPILLLWLVGSIAFFDSYRDRGRAAKAAQVISDIVSRQVEMSDAALASLDQLLDDLLPGMEPGKSLRISSIQFTGGAHAVLWSISTGDLQPLTNADLELIADQLPTMADLDTLIVTETRIPYTPMLGWSGISASSWTSFIPNRPRFVPAIAYVN